LAQSEVGRSAAQLSYRFLFEMIVGMRFVLAVLAVLALSACGSGLQTQANEADRLRRTGEPLKAVAYYDHALKQEIPEDHPEYAATVAKRRAAILAYADQEASASRGTKDADKRLHKLRVILNTARDLDATIDISKAAVFTSEIDATLTTLAEQAQKQTNPGLRFRRLEWLAESGPKNNVAHTILERERHEQLQRYDVAMAQAGPALGYFYSASARRIDPSRSLRERPKTRLALQPASPSGQCLRDLGSAQVTTEGEFPISYSLHGLTCEPSSKTWQQEASYSFVVKVPKTSQRRVKVSDSCFDKTATRTHNVCMEFSKSGTSCIQWGTQQVTEVVGRDCQPVYEMRETTVMVDETRTGTRTETHVSKGYALRFEVRFVVGDTVVSKTLAADATQSDLAFETEHGSKAIAISDQSARAAAHKLAKQKILEAQVAAAAQLGNQRFASATNDEDRAIAALLGAGDAAPWALSNVGLALDELPSILKGEKVQLALITDTAEMPSIDRSSIPSDGGRLKYSDAWKGGTNVYLTEGGDLRVGNESEDIASKDALSVRYERRSGLDDFKFSWWGIMHLGLGDAADNLGWGIGQRTFFGSYDNATSTVYTIGMHYEQQKAEGLVSYRALAMDVALYFPITRYFSLDAAIELNTVKLYEKSKSIDHGSPVMAGASLYLGRRLSTGLHYTKRLFSDVPDKMLLTLTLRH
jgi:hypothetical protein